jgi:hypothetical protein
MGWGESLREPSPFAEAELAPSLPAKNSAASRSEQLRTFAAIVIASPPLPHAPKQ